MRPGMYDTYGGCVRRLGPLILAGLLLWAAFIYGVYRLVERIGR